MAARTGSRRWWTLAILPAMAVSACGGSRLTHDAIVTAVNGGPLSTGAAAPQQQQQEPESAVSALPQNGVAQPLAGTAGAGGVSGGAGNATSSVTGGAAAGAGAVSGAGTAHPGAATGSGRTTAAAAGPLPPILLGNIGTYSGPVGSTTSVIPTMLQVWVQWVNAHGGIAGHPVQLFSADDGGDPAKQRAEVQDLVENKHVIAFISNFAPLNVGASISYLEAKHVPVIGGDMAGLEWTTSPMLFPVGTTFDPAIESTLKAAHKANATKVAAVACVEAAFCEHFLNHVSETAGRYGDQVVYSARISIAQPDFTGQCLQAQQSGARAIAIAADAGTSERLARSCARQNYHPLYMTLAQGTSNQEADDPTLDGLLAPSPAFPYMVPGGNPEIDAYHAAIRQFSPGLAGSGGTAIAWVSGELFKKVASNIGPQPTSDAVLNGLWALRNETLGGLTPPLTYVAHQPAPPVSCYFMVQIRGGRWDAPSGANYECL